MKVRMSDSIGVALCICIVLAAEGADTSLPTSGSWHLNNWAAGFARVQLQLTRATLTSRWSHSSTFNVDDLKGLTRDQLNSLHSTVRFEIARDAGAILCEGSMVAGVGGGTFSFSPSAAFAAELRKLGYTDVDDNTLFSMAMSDVGLVYIREMQKLGMHDTSVRPLLRLRERNISAEDVAEIRSYGYDFTAEDLVRLKDHGVQPRYLRDLKKSGYSLRADEITRLRDHGVDADYVRDIAAAGYKLRVDDVIRLRDHGVAPDYVMELKRAGIDFDAGELTRLRDNGVSSDYIRDLKKSGYDMAPQEIITLRNNGVPASFPSQLKAAGLQDIPLHDMIRMWQNGVRGDYVARLQSSGFKGLTPNQIIKLKQAGVD